MAKTVFCTQCGKEIPESAKFCPECGATQVVSEATRTPRPEDLPPPPPSVPPAPEAPKKRSLVPWGIVGVVVVIVLVAIGIYTLISSGVPPIQVPGITSTPTPIPGSTPDLQPGPTQEPPPGTEIVVRVTKNPITGEITFLFSGGPGQKVVREIEVRVTREDGTILSGRLMPVVLDEVVLRGTKGGTDRAEVMVTYYSGKTYKIVDRQIGGRE